MEDDPNLEAASSNYGQLALSLGTIQRRANEIVNELADLASDSLAIFAEIDGLTGWSPDRSGKASISAKPQVARTEVSLDGSSRSREVTDPGRGDIDKLEQQLEWYRSKSEFQAHGRLKAATQSSPRRTRSRRKPTRRRGR